MRVSNYDYPEDEFDVGEDDGPVPVGVHRAQVPRWRSWVPLLAIIVIVPSLAWGAVTLFLNGTGGSGGSSGTASSSRPAQGGQAASTRASGEKSGKASQPADNKSADASAKPSASASASASSSGNVDFNTGVTVANGTSTSGLAKGASDKLTNGGFTAVNVTPGIYEGEEPAKSTVYFSSPENRPAAEEVGKKLGISNVVESAENAQSNPIVVILRDDYKP